MVLSGGSCDRGVLNSTKTIDTMSAISEMKFGPITNKPIRQGITDSASPGKKYLRKQKS